MQSKKAFLFILILGLVIGSVLTAFCGYFFLPDYKMNTMTHEESEIVRWCYLLVGVTSSVMMSSAVIVWLVASLKAKIFVKPTIVEILVAIAIAILWATMVIDAAWNAFMRLSF